MPDEILDQTDEEISTFSEDEDSFIKDRNDRVNTVESWGFEYNFPDPFLQRDLNKYQGRLRKLGGGKDIAISIYRGVMLKVSIEMGWLSGKDTQDIGGMHPGKVEFISDLIFRDVAKASEVPNE